MELQLILVMLTAVAAAAFLARRALGAWAGECGKSCACDAPKRQPGGLVRPEDLLARFDDRRAGSG